MSKQFSLVVAAALLLGACSAPQPNPRYDRCINSCTIKQDTCMLDVTTANAINKCKRSLDRCVSQCSKKHPRYLKK